jgi:MFS family permease
MSDPDAQRSTVTAADTSRAVSWHSFWTIYLPSLVLALGTGIVVPVIPTLARSFDVSFGLATGVVTAFLIGNVVGTVPTGWYIDRFGRRHVLIAGPLLTAAMAFMVLTAHTFTELLIYRFLDGFAAQMWLIARVAGISHRAAPNQRGRQVTWMFGMNNTGKLAGPLVGGFIGAHFGLRAPFAAYGILALLAVIPAFLTARDEGESRAASGRPASGQAASGQAASGQEGATPSRPSIRSLVGPRLVFFAVVLFASMARGPVQADLFHLYAALAYHLGPTQIGYLAAAAGLLSVPIGLMAGNWMDRYGRKRTMVPGFTGLALAMAALAISAAVHSSLAWYVTLFLLAVGSQSIASGSIQTLGADIAPPTARGMFLGIWRFVGTVAAAISPIAFAALADTLGYGAAFIFVGATSATAAYLLIRHVPETGGRRAAATVAAPPAVTKPTGTAPAA